jgi:hypothetical protein
MKSGRKTLFIALAIFGLLAANSSDAITLFYTAPGSFDSSGSVNAGAAFLPANGFLTVELTDLQPDPGSVGQLLSGISFDIAGASGSGSLSSRNLGFTSTISPGGAYSPGSLSNLPKWKATESGEQIYISALTGGGSPKDFIIGPDSEGGFTHRGKYGQAGSSIIGQPLVLGGAVFIIFLNGITSASQVSNVTFQFGASPSLVPAETPVISAVPEPSTTALFLISGIISIILSQLRKRFQPRLRLALHGRSMAFTPL